MKSDIVKLLPHNEEAYKKLKKCLDENQLVAINHATGTGKSFIILKYLYENKDKRILFISPSYPINQQLINEHTKELGIDINDFAKMDTLIYSNLLKKNMEELANNYDIVILDEYHRCGAKKWGIKVNQLLDFIKKKHPETKVVGTTATEIRYLDNEKNMNNILFDGVCASTLTLADAMLKGILPVPIYINSLVELSTEYENNLKKIYEKSVYGIERSYYLQLIAGVRKQIDEIVGSQLNVENYIKRDGKHLVFSSTISNIERDKVLINKLFNCEHNEYEVHSNKTHEVNARLLKEFRYDQNPAVMYCVNILNEGVHVKGVDSIFMLRPTTSPIIFFQQLGRLLSYSRRKDKVFVFDFVNNIRKSPYIYQLYIDLFKRAKELCESDPDNKERYLNIVESFQIVDAASEIYKKLDIVKIALSKEKFYKKRIDFVIEILQKKAAANVVEEKIAKVDLFKYYKHITLEQFRIIKTLDVSKPSIFNLSEEEFVRMLNGEENIYKKERKLVVLTTNRVINFYEDNGYFPSILSQDDDECLIARNLIKCYVGEKIDESILVGKEFTNLTEYEKVIYGITKDIDFNKLYSEIDQLIAKNEDIYPMFLNLVQKQQTDISRIYVDKVLKYNSAKRKSKMQPEDETVDTSLKENGVDWKVLYSENYEKIAKESSLEIQSADSIEEYLKSLSEEIITYINETKSMPVYYKENIDENALEQMRKLYIKKIIFYDELQALGYITLFDETYNAAQMQLINSNKDRVIERIIVFLKEHNGDMPALKLDSDRELALEFNRVKDVLNDDDIDLINLHRSSTRTSDVAFEYITFVKKHRRYPLITSTDEDERNILNDYIRNENYFSERDKKMIKDLKKVVSSRDAMQNAYIELLKQKKRR